MEHITIKDQEASLEFENTTACKVYLLSKARLFARFPLMTGKTCIVCTLSFDVLYITTVALVTIQKKGMRACSHRDIPYACKCGCQKRANRSEVRTEVRSACGEQAEVRTARYRRDHIVYARSHGRDDGHDLGLRQ